MQQIGNERILAKLFNGLAAASLAGFLIGVAVLLTMPNRKSTPSVTGTLLMEGSTITLILAIMVRDAVSHRKWRFSLRELLIATTLVAVVLGLIVWAVR